MRRKKTKRKTEKVWKKKTIFYYFLPLFFLKLLRKFGWRRIAILLGDDPTHFNATLTLVEIIQTRMNIFFFFLPFCPFSSYQSSLFFIFFSPFYSNMYECFFFIFPFISLLLKLFHRFF